MSVLVSSCNNIISNNCIMYTKGLSNIFNTKTSLPFTFFKQWGLHDFHTSKWSRVNPSAQIKRTRLGKSSIDSPMISMISVNKYGGYTKREILATAFRMYRSVNPSDKTLLTGKEAINSIKITDFVFEDDDEEEGQELVVDFACLYLNACVLFKVTPSQEMLTHLLTKLSTTLYTSFHWECVLCAIFSQMQLSLETSSSSTIALLFISMLRGAPVGTLPENLSREGVILLLLTTTQSLAILFVLFYKTSYNIEDRQYLLDIQLKSIESICTSPTIPLLREELITLVDAICWRYTVAYNNNKNNYNNFGYNNNTSSSSNNYLSTANSTWVNNLIKKLQVNNLSLIEKLTVSQCTKLFCALCLVLAIPSNYNSNKPTIKENNKEWQNVLDPIVRYLNQCVRVHSVSDVVCILIGLQVNNLARLRYKKFPAALLDHLRQLKQIKEEDEKEEWSDKSLLEKETDSLQTLADILQQIGNSEKDELSELAEVAMIDLFPEKSQE